MNELNLEYLINTFKEHSIQSRKNNEKLIEEYKKNYPGEPLPEHFKDNFDLPEALCYMCEEIRKLRFLK